MKRRNFLKRCGIAAMGVGLLQTDTVGGELEFVERTSYFDPMTGKRLLKPLRWMIVKG